FFSSRRRHTRSKRDWSSDVCSSDLRGHPDRARDPRPGAGAGEGLHRPAPLGHPHQEDVLAGAGHLPAHRSAGRGAHLGDLLSGVDDRADPRFGNRQLPAQPGRGRDRDGRHHPVHGGGHSVVVHRRAHPPGGSGRRAGPSRPGGVSVLGALSRDVPLTPSADDARQWAQDELAKAIYNNEPTLLERLLDWLGSLWRELMSWNQSVGPVVLPLVVLAVVLLLVGAGILIGGPVRRRRLRRQGASAVVLDGDERTAKALRAAAEAAAGAEDFSLAVLERFRAI